MSQQFQRGDIVLIHFPFTDLSGGKRRPAVVLAEYSPDVVVAFISSVMPAALAPSDVLLQPTVSTGLKKVSVLRSHKIATLEQGLVTLSPTGGPAKKIGLSSTGHGVRWQADSPSQD